MKFCGIAIATTVCSLAACAGGEKQPGTESGASVSGNSTSVTTPLPASSTSVTVPSPAAAPQPITGKTWEVKMLGDAKGYRFDPASLSIKRGDGVRWKVVSGLPHNVTFWPDSIPSGAASALQAAMTQTTAPLTGPLLMSIGQSYTVSFAGVPAGVYHYYCTPHLALGMIGKITVQ